MTHRDTDSGAQLPTKRLRFGSYILDLHRGCLLLDGSEIALRPKTFAVLHYLVQNAGRRAMQRNVIVPQRPVPTCSARRASLQKIKAWYP